LFSHFRYEILTDAGALASEIVYFPLKHRAGILNTQESAKFEIVVDAFGDEWAVFQRRQTAFRFEVLLGWPKTIPRGRRGPGAPRVIITKPLRAYLQRVKKAPSKIRLPLSLPTIRRLKRLLELDVDGVKSSWFHERIEDLFELTIEEFATKYTLDSREVTRFKTRIAGNQSRSVGWWRGPTVSPILLSDLPVVFQADFFSISVRTVQHLTSMLQCKK
jgi:hypothetical protein